jgi:hypothetical protein
MRDNKALFLNPIITAYVGWIEIHAQALHTRSRMLYNICPEAFYLRNTHPHKMAGGINNDPTMGALWLTVGTLGGLQPSYSMLASAVDTVAQNLVTSSPIRHCVSLLVHVSLQERVYRS